MSSASKQSTGTVPKGNKSEKKVEKSLERRSNTGQHVNVSAGHCIIYNVKITH